jgi:phage-related protein
MALGFNIQTDLDPRYILPDKSLKGTIVHRVKKDDLGTIWEQRYEDGINSIEEEYQVVFENRDIEEALAISAFLDSKNGVESFSFTVRDTNEVSKERTLSVVCDSYNLTYVNKETVTIEGTFKKVISSTLEFAGVPIVPAPTYSLYSSATSPSEGDSITIELRTTGVQNDTEIPYTISGVQPEDIDTPLQGLFTVTNSRAYLTFSILQDNTIEPQETLFVSLDNGKADISFILKEVAPLLDNTSFTVQNDTASAEYIKYIYRADGSIFASSSANLFSSATGQIIGYWISDTSDFNFSDFEILVEEGIIDSRISFTVSPAYTTPDYKDFPVGGVEVSLNASLSQGEGPFNAGFTTTIRQKQNTSNSASSTNSIAFLGEPAYVAPTYTLSLHDTPEVKEGQAVAFKLESTGSNVPIGLYSFQFAYLGGATSDDILSIYNNFYVLEDTDNPGTFIGYFSFFVVGNDGEDPGESIRIDVFNPSGSQVATGTFNIIEGEESTTTAPANDPSTPPPIDDPLVDTKAK